MKHSQKVVKTDRERDKERYREREYKRERQTDGQTDSSISEKTQLNHGEGGKIFLDGGGCWVKGQKDLISKRLEKAILIGFSIRNWASGPREFGGRSRGFMKEIFPAMVFDKR